jgi:sulfide:quinone oxidoreductase
VRRRSHPQPSVTALRVCRNVAPASGRTTDPVRGALPMEGGDQGPMLDGMHLDSVTAPPTARLRVVVAGGGVAGLETLVALNALAADRVAVTLIAPEPAFTLRALDVFEPFGLGRPTRYPLDELCAELGAERRRDVVARVDRARRTVVLGSGAEVPYDVLVAAVGAIPYPAFAHGVPFDRARAPERFDALVADVQSGRASSVAVVVPRGSTWTLPGYELGLMLRAFGGAGRGAPPRVTVVTAEPRPLAQFGPPATELIRRELAAAGVDLVEGVDATVPSDRIVQLRPGRTLRAHRVVHLPLLAGPRIAGLPYDRAGFVAVDEELRAGGVDAVYAVGDGTAGRFKQGGIAAQQADAVAERIAVRAGVERAARPYRPTLRALLRTERGPRYLRAEPAGGDGECLVSDQCLWWPPSKVASRWLTPWLAARDARAASAPRVLPTGGISRGSLGGARGGALARRGAVAAR